MPTAQVLHVHKISSKPASVSFCPFNGFEDILAVGTYAINEKDDSKRTGGCHFATMQTNGQLFWQDPAFWDANAGVFRFAWSLCDGQPVLYCALTDGRLAGITPKRVGTEEPLSVQIMQDQQATVSNGMLVNVSLDSAIDSRRFLLSDSIGQLHLASTDSSGLVLDRSWAAHTLPYTNEPCEVWACCFGTDKSLLYSGADDALLKVWDIRCATTTPILVNKSHGSGVVFLSSPVDYSILSGSYDEKLREFDQRNMKTPVKEVQLFGGVWSVERYSASANAGVTDTSYLVSCMYGGWCVVDTDFNVVASDQSLRANLLYGASKSRNSDVIAVCTFNDGLVSCVKAV